MSKNYLIYIVFFFAFQLYAGDNSDSLQIDNPTVELPSKEYRPELGVGLGYFSLFGDVKNTANRSVYASPIVYSVYAARRLNEAFDVTLRFSTGGMVGNETGPDRYLNFKTILHEGSMFIAYDFSNLFSRPMILQPYLTLGLSVFEFNNKGDLYDANGNFYHYWADGTIRNVAEGTVNSNRAVQLQRDYVYETDLRKANIDGFGRYRQVGFGIPVGLEFEFNVTNRVTFRLGSVFTYSLTDLIDNVNENSTGTRQGKKGGDHYLQNKISFHYDLFNKLRKVEVEEFEFVDFLTLDTEDEDKDGVINEFDTCPFTIKDIKVDEKGCPMDMDSDGIPDYIDIENTSEALADVNELGETYTDEDYLHWYLTFIDSLDVSPEVLQKIADQKREHLPKYRVFLKEYASGVLIPDAEVKELLKEEDVNVFNVKGDKTIYAAGEFLTEAEAQSQKNKLFDKGFEEAQVIVINQNQILSVNNWKKLSTEQIRERYQEDFAKIDALEGSYAVLVGSTDAGATAFDKAKFLHDDKVIMLDGDRNSMDYVKGPFDDTASASIDVQELKLNGFRNAKIVRVENGKVFDLKKEVVSDEEPGLEDELKDIDVPFVATEVRFKVQVGAFKDFSTEKDKLKAYDNVEMEIFGDYKRVLTGDFKTYQEAIALKNILAKKGYPNAFVVAYSGKQRMSLSQVNTNRIQDPEKTPNTVVQDKNLHIMVQIGLYKGDIPADVQQQFNQLQKLTKEVTPEGIVRYLSGDFNNPTEATAYKEELKAKGFKGVFLVAFYKTQRIDIKKAVEIYEQGQ